MPKTVCSIMLILFLLACNSRSSSSDARQISTVRDSVGMMMESIAAGVSQQGPVAWLHYFEDTANFFMASEGRLVFANNDSARNFINHTLVKAISKIELQWHDIRIEPLTADYAQIAATFHEDITDATGKKIPADGYFTGLAHQVSAGWKLSNAHWSVIAKQ
jgi:SnoaL-like domain